jgi:hypothetical protein
MTATECWCCGQDQPADRVVRLGNHPEVAVCPRCARSLHKWAGEIEDRDRTGWGVRARTAGRQARATVIRKGWHRHRMIGAPLRWLGRRLP